ncbi:MAG: sigma 54-interacting transcriptional regulator [Terriglobales bacterium]
MYLPLALQPKLLRVLQEQEFERLGSGRTHRISVRPVTATHRDLTEMVARRGEEWPRCPGLPSSFRSCRFWLAAPRRARSYRFARRREEAARKRSVPDGI